MIIIPSIQTAKGIEPSRELTDSEKDTVIAMYYIGDGFYHYYQDGDTLPDQQIIP